MDGREVWIPGVYSYFWYFRWAVKPPELECGTGLEGRKARRAMFWKYFPYLSREVGVGGEAWELAVLMKLDFIL